MKKSIKKALSKCQQLALLLLLCSNLGAQEYQGFSSHKLVSAGVDREFILYVPEVDHDNGLALVFSLHGSGSIPQTQVDVSHFDILAERHGFAVVFPAGAFTNSIIARSWNANKEEGVDDIQFVRDMIKAVSGMLNIDQSRIYTSGYSGGARMSSRLACELSDVLAAAAPVAGLQSPDDCIPKRAIPIIAFHARDDQVNNYVLGKESRPYWRMGVETALDKWRQANACSLANADAQLSGNVSRYIWADCEDSAEINYYLSEKGGHTWPGADNSGVNNDINSTTLIWEFFSRHQLPE
jgi:polyhydroxybutyrate depolymerase